MMKTAKMWAKFSKTAAANPHAWSKCVRTPEEIITPGPCNRITAFPYTKYMNSFVTVDQGAAIILMSEQLARRYGPKDRRCVYFLGGGYARDRQRFMIEKSDFTISPPLKAAVSKALKRSSMSIDELECFDFYSCFPCAVSIAKKMTGIKDNDPRPLTLTGGLGFFGGPGNNYSLHSAATLAEKISRGEKSNGLITALGWFMHKHAAGIYGYRPPQGSMENHDIEDRTNPFAGDSPVMITEKASGTGIIETEWSFHGRDMQPAYALIYGRTHDNLRFIARTRNDPEIFSRLAGNSMVGTKVRLKFDPGCSMNIADPV
jgi:acetyl-CoA C-acetyltransferase